MKTKKRILSILIALCMIFGTMPPITMTASAADGVPVLAADGYYEIATTDELYWFAEQVNSGNYAINGRLTADIVINKNVLTADGELNGDGSNFRAWTPIGNDANRYIGIFDGQNHNVSGLYFDDDTKSFVGLFGITDTDSEIKNVGVIDSYIEGEFYVSGVCAFNGATITNCYNTGTVRGTNAVAGGVCGANLGKIENCYNAGAVGKTDDSVSTYVGGVCGGNDSTITNCYNIGEVVGLFYVGGVCGPNNGTITNCYNTGVVSGNAEVGGVCGGIFQGAITNCYNTGTVSGTDDVGGMCGRNDGTITNCYYLNTAYNGGINGTDVAGSAEAKTTEKFAAGEVCYLLNGSTSEGDLVWRQNLPGKTPADTFPVLDETHGIVGFDGSAYYNIHIHEYDDGFCTDCGQYQPAVLNDDGVYEIGNAGQLYWFAALVNGDNTHADFEAPNKAASAKLTADIVINENVLTEDGELNGDGSNFRVWRPIGDYENQYVGVFDGQNHTVSCLYFNNDEEEVGLFGCINTDSEIKNIGVIDSYIKGENIVGGVCGENYGTIENCYNTGAVSSSYNVGGVCGVNEGTIINCYNTGTVSGTWSVGGMCGYNLATITNCYYLNTAYNGGINGADVAGSAEAKTAEQFKSGEVCYLLNGDQSNIAFKQNIGTDAAPNFTGAQVYQVDKYDCPKDTVAGVGYSNTNEAIQGEHPYDSNGFCTVCDQYQPAVLNADGIYEIGNAGQLYWFAALVNGDKTKADFEVQNKAADAKLTADIVINKNVLTADGDLNGDGEEFRVWMPMGSLNYPYAGIFDGQSHTVSGLYFNDDTQDKVGLFGYADTDAEIKKVGMIDSYIKGGLSVGGMCGENRGTITSCYNTGTVSATIDYAGGICGFNNGTVEKSYNIGRVSGKHYVGGMCGVNVETIEKCYNVGTVSGSSEVGGVSGLNYGAIANCYNTGTVSGIYDIVGGVNGLNYGSITNCYYLEGSADQGSGYGTGETTVKTTEQFASGEVCYLLNGSTSDGDPAWRQNIENYVAPADASPVLDPTHAIVRFDGTIYENDCTHIKYEDGFCKVCGQYQPAVLNADGIYEISNAGQLYWFAALVNGDTTKADFEAPNKAASAKLTADIVINKNVLTSGGKLNGDGSNFRIWTPIGNWDYMYAGVFDGDGHTVSGLYFNNDAQDDSGLFGHTDNGSVIENVGVIDGYIKGHAYLAGVCGFNNGTIANCYNTSAVSGINMFIGGVCGDNYGTIKNCYNIGAVSVSENGYFGGVCGYNWGTIENCYNTGAVSGNGYFGSVCGVDYGAIKNCYYLEGSAAQGLGFSAGEAIVKTSAEFRSGEVCYLLNGDQSSLVFKQNIGTDAAPNFTGKQVYQVDKYDCQKDTVAGVGYSNTNEAIQGTEHLYDSNGFCIGCDQYQPAVLNDDGVYEIGNAGQLYWFAALVNGDKTHADFEAQNRAADAKLTADIVINENVLTGDGELNGDGSNFRVWTPIGNSKNEYSGIFDGQNHTVSGLYFNDDTQTDIGLSGYTDTGSEIKNVGVIDSYMKGESYVGGVCGVNDGTIKNCYNTGVVSVIRSYVGGVCGVNDGTIENCYNTGAVSNNTENAISSVGGVCGMNMKRITDCYNTGSVRGYSVTGGVCGQNYGTIENCYNIGSVSGEKGSVSSLIGGAPDNESVKNCYYLEGCGGNKRVGTSKNAAEFASGEVCYLLNGDQTNIVFKQTIGTDDFPTFKGSTLYVVTFTDYAGTEENAFVYGNEGGTITIPAPYHTGYAFKDLAGKFVTPMTVFGTENVTYTAIPAPTYTVTIPENVTIDKTNIDSNGDYVKTGFDVKTTAGWLAGNGKTLTVSVESANGYQMKVNGAGTGVPYTYTAGTTTLTVDNKTVLTLTGDNEAQTASGTLKVNKADVIYAGKFTDTLTFTIALK